MRKEFINAKYVDHKYARKTCSSAAAKMIELFEAVQSRDLLTLIQVYAEGVELMEPLPEAGPVSPVTPGRADRPAHVEKSSSKKRFLTSAPSRSDTFLPVAELFCVLFFFLTGR